MSRNNSPEWIAQRCKWEFDDAVERGDTRIVEVLGRCLRGSAYGRKPKYVKPPYKPMSNTLTLLNSVGGGE